MLCALLFISGLAMSARCAVGSLTAAQRHDVEPGGQTFGLHNATRPRSLRGRPYVRGAHNPAEYASGMTQFFNTARASGDTAARRRTAHAQRQCGQRDFVAYARRITSREHGYSWGYAPRLTGRRHGRCRQLADDRTLVQPGAGWQARAAGGEGTPRMAGISE